LNLLYWGVGNPGPDLSGDVRKGDKRTLALPVVVKPACQGSSIGVHRIFSESDWNAALEDAFRYGSEMIVETFIEGRELTVGIIGQEALPVVEIVAPDGGYSYEVKYTKGKSKYLVPAPIDDKTVRECQKLALRVFKSLGCRGLARVDFRMTGKGELFVLELNSIPGFTETSLLPMAAAQSGLNFPALCDRIVQTIEL